MITPQSLNVKLHNYYHSLPPILTDKKTRKYLSSFELPEDLKQNKNSLDRRLNHLNKLPYSSLWMGSIIGVGQRVENGMMDWFFPEQGD